MEIDESDLSAWRDDWMIADKAECTVDGYIVCLHKYRAWCVGAGLQTSTVRAAKAYLATLSKWQRFMTCRALKAFGKWFADEYRDDDPYWVWLMCLSPSQHRRRSPQWPMSRNCSSCAAAIFEIARHGGHRSSGQLGNASKLFG